MKSISRSMIIGKLVGVVVTILVVGGVSTQAAEKQEFDAAKQEYEQSSRDESARIIYITKLAKIADRLVSQYRGSGQRNDELMGAINSELQNHPAPKDIDSKKLRQLLVGKWESPRHTYVYRANDKWGIQRNQIVWGEGKTASYSTIILLNSDYLIYTEGDAVFFHSRVKE